MSWLVVLILLLSSFYLIYRLPLFRSTGITFKWLGSAFILKLFAGVFYLWLYSDYYTRRDEADVFKYFDDGLVIRDIARESVEDFSRVFFGFGEESPELIEKYLYKTRFWEGSPSLPFFNDNRFIIRFNALMMFFSGGNIYAHLIVAIFIAFTGLTYLYLFLRSYIVNYRLLSFLSVFFLPSVLIWTSGILKENFLMLGFGAFLYYLDKEKKRLREYALIVFCSALIIMSKLYVFLVIIPPVLAFYWSREDKNARIWLKYLVINLFFFSLMVSIGDYHPQYKITNMLAFKQSEFKCLADWTGAGSLVFIPDIDQTYMSFIKAAPYALYNVLFRPMPWNDITLLSLPASLELFAILLLVSLGILFRTNLNKRNLAFVLFSVNFIFLLSLLIGWTTPVVGAIVRYRILLLPFLMALPLIMSDTEKLGKFAHQLKKL